MNMKKMKKFFTLSRRAEGFTLVELIVVIAILAILGGVAVPAYSGYVKKANMQADISLAAEVADALILYYYSHPGEVTGGYVVLKNEISADADEGVGTAAMQAVFGENWANSATLKHDGWGAINGLTNLSNAIAESSFAKGNIESLLGDVQHCANSLSGVLADRGVGAEALDDLIGNGSSSYVSDYLSDYEDDEITADMLANATVFGLANQVTDDAATVQQNFATGKYLLNNWENTPAKYGGYNETNRLDYIDSTDTNLLGDTANTYAALEAFSAYMGIEMELEFDPATATKANVTKDIADECNRIMNIAAATDPEKMQAYLEHQAATDAEAYISVMNSINAQKADYKSDLANTQMFNNGDMLGTVNAYVAISGMDADLVREIQGLDGTKGIIVLLDASGNVHILPAKALPKAE